MANTKITADNLAANAVTASSIADNSIGITQLNVSDGTNGQVLTTNGSGTLSFSTISGYTDSDVETYLDTGTSTPTFSTATVTGDLTVDTDTLVVSASGDNVGIGTSTIFGTTQISNTAWSGGAPYGTVLTVTGNNTNDANWGHLLISDSTTTTGNGGMIRFATGSTTSDMNPFAGIDGFTEGSAYGGLKFLTRPSGGTATERLRINSSGTLGINTQSPSSTPLHVNSFSGNTLTAVFEAPASNNFDVQFRSHSYYGGITFWSDFYGSNLQYGSIGQYINGGMYATANRGYWYFQVGNAGTTRIQYQMDWDNHKWFTNTAYNGAMELTYVGHLRINGSLYQSYNFSDERLKENVQTLTGSLEKVKQLRGVSFNFKESKEGIYTSEDNQIGVVAQELEQHYPELISEQAEMTEDGEDGVTYKYVHYEKLTPILIEAIKEQQTIIDDLKSRLDSAGL